MSAERVSRSAWWRRWASLPVVAALFFATSVLAATAAATEAARPDHLPPAVQVAGAQAQQATGQRPDLRADARGGPGTVAPELAALAWLSARAGARTTFCWQLRQDSDGHRAQARGAAYQGRGPPGRRATDAQS